MNTSVRLAVVFSALALSSIHSNTNAQIIDPAPYCIANYNMNPPLPDASGSGISNVTLGTLNSSTNYQGAQTYHYYNNLQNPVLSIGASYTISITFSAAMMAEPQYYAAWIDFNKNNTFEENELIINNANSGGTELPFNQVATRSRQFTVPATASTGSTRMRVLRGHDAVNILAPYNNGFTPSSCFPAGASTRAGEVEDYNVTLTNGNANTPPVMTIKPATGIMATEAVLNGTVVANSQQVSVYFEYGTTTQYGMRKAATPASVTGTAVTDVSTAITGLAVNTTYHMRLIGVVGTDTTRSSDLTFITSKPTAVENVEAAGKSILLFPNPCRDKFMIDVSGLNVKSDELTALVFSIDGRQMLKCKLAEPLTTVSVSALPPGCYQVAVLKAGHKIYAATLALSVR